MKKPPGNHPVWGLGRLAVLFVGASLILWINATSFDATEIRSILEIFLLMVAAEGGVRVMKK